MKLFNTKKYSKIIALVLCLVMALTLTACAKDNTKDSTDDGEMLRQAQKNAESVKSLHFDMQIDMKMAIDGEAMDNSTKMTADITQKPMVGKMTMDMGELGASNVYFKENGDKYDYYMGVDNGEGKVEWMKMQMDADALQQYDVADSADELLKMQDYLKRTGTDKVNGRAAVKFDGVVTGEDMMKMVSDSGAMGNLGVADIDDLEDAVSGKNITMSISIWVDQETCMPVKYAMDMTELTGAVMDALSAEEGMEDISITVSKLVVTVELSQINEIGEIEIPAEALNAQSMDDMLEGLDELDTDVLEDAA